MRPDTVFREDSVTLHAQQVDTVDDEEMDEASVAELMELDIISIDEDDFDMSYFDGENSSPAPQPANSCFNWDTTSRLCGNTTNSMAGNFCGLENWSMMRNQSHASSSVPQQPASSHLFYGQQTSESISHQQHQQSYVYQQHSQQQQQQQGQQFTNQSSISNFYNATAYFCAR